MSSTIRFDQTFMRSAGERFAAAPGRMRYLAALGAVLLALAPDHASALPSGFGSSCSYNGSTGASVGSPPSPGSNAVTISGACGGDSATSNGQVNVPVQTDAGPNIFSFVQSANTTVGARASLGNLGAFSNSSATSNPGAYFYTSNGDAATTENEYGASGRSGATASWWDLLTIGGTANANGFVVLAFTLNLSASSFASSPEMASASIESRLFINDFSRFNDQIIDLTTPGSNTQTIGFRQGQQVQIYGDLNVSSSAAAGRQFRTICNGFLCFSVRGDYFSDSSAGADAADTAGFSVDVVTPGGSYSTLSGANYATVATSVPEPSTWALLAGGLFGLATLARKQRARPR